jgi:hypothetical protein
MSISPVNPEDYNRAITNLRRVSPIANKQLLGLVGETREGNLVLIPGSYERGYSNALLPPNQRPHYTLNLGIIGQLSDGTLVFPPSYNSGLSHGLNDLRFTIMVEVQKRQANRNQETATALEATQAKLRELQEEVDRMKREKQQ